MKLPKSQTYLLLLLFPLALGCHKSGGPQQNASNPQTNLESATQTTASNNPSDVTITGRLVDENSSPIAGVSVMIMEASASSKEGGEISATMKTGPDEKLANPETTTDSDGRFSIVADRRFWEGTGKFTIHGGFLPGTTTNAGYLQGANGSPLLISIDARTSGLDLGDIHVKKE